MPAAHRLAAAFVVVVEVDGERAGAGRSPRLGRQLQAANLASGAPPAVAVTVQRSEPAAPKTLKLGPSSPPLDSPCTSESTMAGVGLSWARAQVQGRAIQ